MIARREVGSSCSFPGGFTLIEVVIALVVVSIALVSLMSLFLSATEKANELGRQLAAAPVESDIRADLGADPSAEGRGESAWAWSGASVENVLWHEDGLHLRVRVPPGPVDIQVGWWVDGWQAGISSVSDPTSGRVLLSGLRDVAEQTEVVVRLRTAEGSWGVPWRTVRGEVGSAADADADAGGGEAGADADRPVIIVHGAASGISSVTVAPPPSACSAATPEWPAVVTAICGRVEVDCDGRTQALQVPPRGLFHLYF
ncbi:MAG: prepilin-type N-terminal cleavage/methylation domain-containing protein [Thermoleophilia bacterium]